MDVDLWKQCLLSLFFGASTEKEVYISQEEQIEGGIYSGIVDWCNKSDAFLDPDILFANFLLVAQPFVEVRDKWLGIIKKRIMPQEAYTRKGKQYLDNAVGKTMIIPRKINQKILREISAFLLQGLESSFIYNVMLLSDDYGFEVRSCEYDGLITFGTISDGSLPSLRPSYKFENR